MTTAAIVIGIDDYQTQPLTSAVKDAVKFCDTLVELKLVVEREDVDLLIAPGDGAAPTRKGILDALRPFYTLERNVDRLFVYYAGHGLLAFADGARALHHTALVPVDVRSLDRDGDLLIDLDAVITRLRLSGPAEQYFFIDACRDLAYEEHPDVTSALGWQAMQQGPESAQAVLYAVPPLGKAQGERNGLGVMTRHLIDALHAKGMALDYDDDARAYVVTAESIAAYVEKRVLQTIGPVPLWQRKYTLPRLDHRDPKTSALRTIAEPEESYVTVTIEPQDASPATRVLLSQMGIDVGSWPPNLYDQPCAVKPRRYWLDASSLAGVADPDRVRLDAREQDRATFRIRPRDEEVLGLKSTPEPGPSPAIAEVSQGPVAPRVHARANEPAVAVELERLDPPYTRWSAVQELDEHVAPGAYRIDFRLGLDVFSTQELQLGPGDSVKLQPTVGASAVVAEMRASGQVEVADPPTSVEISEQIGPMQAGVVATMLPVIGIKQFDAEGRVFGRFDGSVVTVPRGQIGPRPLALVVAIDGNRWPVRAGEVLDGLQCEIAGHDRAASGVQRSGRDLKRLGRIGYLAGEAPGPTFAVRIASRHVGELRIAAASIVRRATVISVNLKPNGAIDVSQNLLRLPGEDYRDELVPDVPFGQMVRQLQLGQKLFQSGELAEHRDQDWLRPLFYAKWTDPIVSCMAYFAWLDHVGATSEPWLLDNVARNLLRFFGELPDARVIHSLQNGAPLAGELSRGELPVLARTAHELAAYAIAHGRVDVPVIAASRRIAPGQPWLISWDPHKMPEPVAV